MPKCFVISPFGDPFDDYYEQVYKPAIEEANLEAERGDEVYGAGAIIDDIFNSIIESVVVLCEVTGKNPNVNYELGIAHALKKPAIIITQNIDDVPFDYRHLRVVTYDQKKVDWSQQLGQAISKTILAVLADPKKALAWNPVEEVETTLKKPETDGYSEVVISYSPDPSIATLRFDDQFVRLSARSGDVRPHFKSFFIEIYEDVKKLKNHIGNTEFLQLRSIWHDDKRGNISISIDLIHERRKAPSLTEEKIKEGLHDGGGWYAGQGINVEVRIYEALVWSDGFFPNSPEYYE